MAITYARSLYGLVLLIGFTPLCTLAQSFVNTADTTTHRLYDYPASQYGLALAPLNDDPFPDLITTSRVNGLVTIRYNNGRASFGEATTLAVGNKPVAVVAADFNNDGKVDLAVGASSLGLFDPYGTVDILLNGGTGPTHISHRYTTVLNALNNLTVADFNEDGRPDIALSGGQGSYQLLLGQGDGTFAVGPASTPNNTSSLRTTAADFDRDGHMDLAICSSNEIRVLRNAGGGEFTPLFSWTLTGASMTGFTSGDLDNDGWPDVVATTFSKTNSVFWLPNKGNGQFGRGQPIGDADLPTFAQIADVTGDGYVDLLVGQLAGTAVQLWPGTAAGPLQARVTYQTGAAPFNLAVADLNADTKPDLAVLNRDNGTAAILLNRGQGQLGSASILPAGGGTILADLDKDGYADLVGLTNDTTVYGLALHTYRNLGGGQFASPRYQPLGVNIQPVALASADLNKDGWADLVTSNQSNSLTVLLNDRQGKLTRPTQYSIVQPKKSLLIDVNKDTYADIITLSTAYADGGFLVFLNRGDGTFVEPAVYRDLRWAIPNDILAVDMNGDEHPDIVILKEGGIRLYLNEGNGRFSTVTEFALTEYSGSIVALDVDVDGRMDWLISTGSGVRLIRNLGPGGFTLIDSPLLTEAGSLIASSDMNDDGLPDLFTFMGNNGQYDARNTVLLWLNTGAGSFTRAATFPLGFFSTFSTGELNGDGRPDVLTGLTNASYLWYNQVAPRRWGIQTIQPGEWHQPQTWSANRVPIASDHVLLRHPVQAPATGTTRATRVGFGIGGQLRYRSGSQLRLSKRP